MIPCAYKVHIFNLANNKSFVRSMCTEVDSSVLLLFAGGDNGSSSFRVNRSGPVY